MDNVDFDLTGLKGGASVYAGYHALHRQYIFASYLTSTTCDAFAINIDTGAAHPLEFLKKGILSMGTSYEMYSTTGVGQQTLLFGDYNGFLYYFSDTYPCDGAYSGTTEYVSGRVLSSTSSTLVGIGATFYATNDGLKGQALTVVYADGTKASYLITSNTSTELTISGTFTVTPVHWKDRFYIGGIDLLVHFHRLRDGVQKQRFKNVTFSMDVSTQVMKMGATFDEETSRTNYKEVAPDYRNIVKVDRRGYTISPFIETFGNNFTFDLADVDVESTPVKGT
jgi:hypothetical protein